MTLNAETLPRYRILGHVLDDSSERPLSGEQVELVSSTGTIVRATVNAQGVVAFAKIFPGSYVLRLLSSKLNTIEKKVVVTDGSVDVELRASEKR
jgi:hypothetical protein